jgi:stage III sporulation protein AC
MDVSIILKIGLIGLILVIIDMLIKSSGKSELANIVTLGGVIILVVFVLTLVSQLFTNVKALFQF